METLNTNKEEQKVAQELLPEEVKENRESVDTSDGEEKYHVAGEQVTHSPEVVAQIASLRESLKAQSLSEAVPATAVQEVTESDELFKELVAEYPEIARMKFGQARSFIESTNLENEFGDVEKVTLPLVSIPMGAVALNASAIPTLLGAIAAGPTGVITGAGIAAAGLMGATVLAGAGYLAYGGYKLFKYTRGKMRVHEAQMKLKKVYQ